MTDAHSETLKRLLAAGETDDAEYHGGLSNHLPMTLIALEKLGASSSRLEAYFDAYQTKLEPLQQAQAQPTRATWKTALGGHRHYAAFAAFFTAELSRNGKAETLRTYLPELFEGVAAGAFHALIRLGYALDANHDAETARALAYFASRYQPLGATSQPSGKTRHLQSRSSHPQALYRQLSQHPEFGNRHFTHGFIFENMEEVALLPEFGGVIDWINIDSQTLNRLAAAHLAIYLQTCSFVALHLVTSAHALRLVLPYLPKPDAALRFYWQASAAAYIAIGAPAISPAALSEEAPTWESLIVEAVQSPDDHLIKFTYTCREEATAYQTSLYRLAAARAAAAALC